jgi:RNA polymerase sigma-70 factor (ECF subfamily)
MQALPLESCERSSDGDLAMMSSQAQAEFVAELTAAQSPLFGYITTLLGDVHAASNVLQETNIVLWTKAHEFQLGTSFIAWAREVAYYKALSHIRDLKRDKLIVDYRLAERAFSRVDNHDADERRIALRHCMATLDERQRQLLQTRYADGTSIGDIAREQHKTEGAISMALSRIRQALVACVRRRLAAG